MTARAIILDVGHGNATVIHDDDEMGDEVSIVDAAKAEAILKHLGGQRKIAALLISHSDRDHVAGASALLTDGQVRAVYANSDPIKGTDTWRHFVTAATDAHYRGTLLYPALNSIQPGVIVGKSVRLEIIAPTPPLALGGAGFGGRTSNTVSAVVRVVWQDVGRVLLAADMDGTTLEEILLPDRGPPVNAEVLVFPHHGGSPGKSEPTAFAETLSRAVDPDYIVFSIGRGHNPSNPSPKIMAGVKAGAPTARLLCTQLSHNCCAADRGGSHPGEHCAGSIEITFGDPSSVNSSRVDHVDFIRRHAPTTLCRPDLIAPPPDRLQAGR